MAKAELNPALSQMSGRFGRLVFRQQYGRTVVAELPTRRARASSSAQKAGRSRFQLATAYARAVLADPLQRRLYQALAKARNQPVNALLVRNYLNPPVVDLIDLAGYHGRAGDVIKILASDDIEVVAVNVTIHTTANVLIEQGAAAKIHGVWCYRATTTPASAEPLAIEATAQDRPGHEARATVVYP